MWMLRRFRQGPISRFGSRYSDCLRGILDFASEAQVPYAGTDSRLVVVNAHLTCAGADILVIVMDAPMAQVLAVSTALEADAFQARAGADWICIFVCAA